MNSETETRRGFLSPWMIVSAWVLFAAGLFFITFITAVPYPSAVEVPPTEVERFISGEALVKDGVRVRIHTNKYYNLKEYTRRGDVPGLTEVYDRLRVQGYLTPHQLALSAPYPTMISCGLGRFNGDFSLECTKLLSAEYPHMLGSEDPERYMGMQIELRTREHLGERVDWLEFKQALDGAVRAFSQAAAGRAPTVKG